MGLEHSFEVRPTGALGQITVLRIVVICVARHLCCSSFVFLAVRFAPADPPFRGNAAALHRQLHTLDQLRRSHRPTQITANRLNAQNSTGPKPEQAKAAVAANACKHGLRAAFTVLANQNQTEFDQLINQFRAQFQPPTSTSSSSSIRAR